MVRVFVVVVLVALGGCKKKSAEYGVTGAACTGPYSCAETCNSATKKCAPRGTGGEACGQANDCLYGCVAGACDTEAGKSARAAAEAAERAKEQAIADLAKNRELLKASGIEPTAEIVPLAGDPASRIRLATTKAKSPAFAACHPDERLVGGGCRGSSGAISESYPSSVNVEDTVGGRWNCAGQGDEITSIAMCAKLPPK